MVSKGILPQLSTWIAPGLVAVLLLSAVGCAGVFDDRSRQAATTSVVDFLYPDQREPVAEQGVPRLNLPMRVGIAFVPEHRTHGGLGPTEARKAELLERVAAHFRAMDDIGAIEIIPSGYLTPGGGFTNLDQLVRLNRIETVVLVSYDQTQFTGENRASILYWTIVGAYFVEGEENSTATLVDAVVMHVPSRTMLFRAPGTSRIEGRATPVNLEQALREDREAGLDAAFDRMIESLDVQLVAFEERVKASPEEFEVARDGEVVGAVAFEGPLAMLLAALLLGGLWWSRREA